MTPDEREALALRASEAASKMARKLRMDVHHGELDQCVRAALAVAEPVVRADEREACAKVADETPDPHNIYRWPDAISDAIRARGAA